jgi:hypothetical protein
LALGDDLDLSVCEPLQDFVARILGVPLSVGRSSASKTRGYVVELKRSSLLTQWPDHIQRLEMPEGVHLLR